MKKTVFILLILSIFLYSCSSKNDEIGEGTPGINIAGIISSEYGVFNYKRVQCSMDEIPVIDHIEYYGQNTANKTEQDKRYECLDNIEALTCDSQLLIDGDLSAIDSCFYYETMEGFPTYKDYCINKLSSFCMNVKKCTDGEYCVDYDNAPYREGCAEGTGDGEYLCTGDISLSDICEPYFTEYNSGCHDEGGSVDREAIGDRYCDHFKDIYMLEHPEMVDQFSECSWENGVCSLYDVQYDLTTIEGCDFIFNPE